jgi:hypothetical protein
LTISEDSSSSRRQGQAPSPQPRDARPALQDPDDQEDQRDQADADRQVDEGEVRADDADDEQDEGDEDECPADDDHVVGPPAWGGRAARAA